MDRSWIDPDPNINSTLEYIRKTQYKLPIWTVVKKEEIIENDHFRLFTGLNGLPEKMPEYFQQFHQFRSSLICQNMHFLCLNCEVFSYE